MSKIVVPEALKSISDERNFFIYQMPMKIPVALGKVDRARNTDEVAVSTLWEVVEKLDYLDRKPEVLERINGRRAEWASNEGIEPRLIDGFCVGYVPREESGGVVVDLDKCVTGSGGEVVFDDLGLWEAVEQYRESGGYWEVSPSGTGLRVVLPRGGMEDELRSDRREAGGVAFQAAQEKAKGFTLTLSGDGAWQRGAEGDRLVSEVVRVRDAAMLQRRTERVLRNGTVEEGDMALEWAHVSLEDLEGILAAIPNEGPQKSERGWFVGMTKAIRETFEPRGLGEAAWDAWDAWVGSREDGGYDYEWNRRVWDEPLSGRSGEMSLAGLIGEARDAGWRGSWEIDTGGVFDLELDGDAGRVEGSGRGEVSTPDWSNPLERFYLVTGDFFDLKTQKFVSADAMDRMTSNYSMTWDNGKRVEPSARKRYMAKNVRHVDAVDFWPGMDRTFIGREGDTLNTYTPLPPIVGGPGECDVWLDRVRDVFGEREAEIIFDWMAFVLQNPGKKIGWALVLLSEHEGAGKDFTLSPLVKALGKYVSTTPMNYIAEDKNAGVIFNKMFLLVEEGAVGKFNDKMDISEKLKNWIGGDPDTIPIRAMRKDLFEVQNVLNIALVGNHLDALHMESNSRRYYPIITEYGAELSLEEKRKRWSAEWSWMKDREGWKACARWLMERELEGRVSAGMPAPTSPYMTRVLRAGMPPGADWVEEYVEGRSWVSTRQIAEAAAGVEQIGGVRVPTGKLLVRVLEGFGFRKLSHERLAVKVRGVTQKHMVLTTREVDRQIIIEALTSDDVDKIDKSQKRGHLASV